MQMYDTNGVLRVVSYLYEVNLRGIGSNANHPLLYSLLQFSCRFLKKKKAEVKRWGRRRRRGRKDEKETRGGGIEEQMVIVAGAATLS